MRLANAPLHRSSANNATITPICPAQKMNIHRTRLAYRSLSATFTSVICFSSRDTSSVIR